MSAPQVVGTWTVLDQFMRSYLSFTLHSPRGREFMCRAGGQDFDSVLSYFNFSLDVFLILSLNRVLPEDKDLNLTRV